MKKYFIVTCLILSVCVHAQISWPVITQTAKPWTRWWWQGSAVNKKDLTAAMELYGAAGLGGLEITPIYGVKGKESEFIPFLSAQWMDMLQHTLQEAKRLDMGIDMANATGWPFGGPWVMPEDACKNVNMKIYSLKAGEQLNEPLLFTQAPFYRSESHAQVDLKKLSYPIATNSNLQSYAFDQLRFEMSLTPSLVMGYSDQDEIIDLTNQLDKSGRLNWKAKQGNWKLYALFTGFHGKMVERAAPGGEGDVIDHFNAKALQHYLQHFDSAFANHDISGIRAFFNDSYEVDDALGQSNWTPALLDEFKKRRGYDLRNYIPLLFGRDSTDTGRRVLADYRQTISDLLLDHFTQPWQQWAAAKNKMVRNQSHGSPANILDLYAVVDIPETEGADILRFKFATSTAHVTGKPLASSETATWLNEHFQSSLGDVKQAVDKYFVGGVNHVFWHGTSYSPQNEPWPGWLFYAAVHFTPANSFWKDFSTLNNYVARCQSFLQQGKPDNDVLLYFPFNDRIMEMGRDLLLHFDGMEGFDKTVFKSSAEWMLKKGYAFDLVSDKQVQQLQCYEQGLLTGGVLYKTIVLTDVHYIPTETFAKLMEAAKQGAHIVFYQHLPTHVPGLANLAERQSAFNKMIAGLTFSESNSGIRKAVIGRGSFLVGNDLEALLQNANVFREGMVESGLQYARRKTDNGHTYFITNTSGKAFSGWIPLLAKEKNTILFNPMTEEAGTIGSSTDIGGLRVFLRLKMGESCILQTTNTEISPKTYPIYYWSEESRQILKEKWQLSFLNGGPVLPTAAILDSLGSWTELPGNDKKAFSGTAMYSIHFSKPVGAAAYYQLNLGRVEESAEVFLNGKKLATLIGPDFSTEFSAVLLQEDNFLQIKVTNGMANRIADLDKKGVQWKKFYNTNFPSRLPQNRGTDGIFTAANWLPRPSGLLGPVTLQPGKKY